MQANLAMKLEGDVVVVSEEPAPMSEHLPRKVQCHWPRGHGARLIVDLFSFVVFGLSAAWVEVALAQAVAFS